MPVEKPRIRVTKGWKEEEKKRFGPVVELIIPTVKQVEGLTPVRAVFHFAATLDDLALIRRYCDMVEEVDQHNKSLYRLSMEAESYDNKEVVACDVEKVC